MSQDSKVPLKYKIKSKLSLINPKWRGLILAIIILTGIIVILQLGSYLITSNQSSNEETTQEFIESNTVADGYSLVLPYIPGVADNNIQNKYFSQMDGDEITKGLVELSKEDFSTSSHSFQEGQHLGQEEINQLLRRELTDSELEGESASFENIGINPSSETQLPAIVRGIVEQNYVSIDRDGNVKLEGISIGIIIDGYYESDGTTVAYDQELILQVAEIAATNILTYLKSQAAFSDVDILIGIYVTGISDEAKSGGYIGYYPAVSGNSLSKYKEYETLNILFTTNESAQYDSEVNTDMIILRDNLQDTFSTFISVNGQGRYVNNNLDTLHIKVYTQTRNNVELNAILATIQIEIESKFSNVDVSVTIHDNVGISAYIYKERKSRSEIVVL